MGRVASLLQASYDDKTGADFDLLMDDLASVIDDPARGDELQRIYDELAVPAGGDLLTSYTIDHRCGMVQSTASETAAWLPETARSTDDRPRWQRVLRLREAVADGDPRATAPKDRVVRMVGSVVGLQFRARDEWLGRGKQETWHHDNRPVAHGDPVE